MVTMGCLRPQLAGHRPLRAARSALSRSLAAPTHYTAPPRDFADWFVKAYIRNGQVVGLGTGAWASCCIEAIGTSIAQGRLQDVVGVPASDVAASEAAFHGVPLTSLDAVPQIDVAFDEVDSMDTAANAFVIGTQTHPQQPQIARAREMIKASKTFVALLDSSSCLVKRLAGYLPVVIEGEDWESPAEALDDIFLGDAELWRRPAAGTANPRGGDFPYISDEGHNILDIRFTDTFKLIGEDADYAAIAAEISAVPGVVTHGLVLEGADHVVVADATPLATQLR